MKAAIYARYSSDKQTDTSIEAQTRACNDYAAHKGFSIVRVYVDEAVSGKGSKTASREQYQRMLKDCGAGLFETILIHKFDRVARSLAEHVNLETKLDKLGVELIAVAQDFGASKEAKIMRALMYSLSEYYLDNLAEETRKGLKEIALKGLHTGGVAPFGYDVVDQRYTVNELEAGYVKKIFQAAANREGFSAILKEMQDAGIKGKRGKPIKYTQVYEMLRNEKYTGVYAYSPTQAKKRAERRTKPNAIRVDNGIPTIIERSLFEEVQRIMNERKQTGRKAGYLCSGLVYCECGAKMHGTTSKRKGHEYKYFTCSAKCGAPVVHMDDVDKAAVDYLQELLSPANLKRITEALREYQSAAQDTAEQFNKVLQGKISEKEKQYDALLANLSAEALPPEVVTDIGQKMQDLKDEIEVLKQAEPPQDFTVDQIKAWLESLKAAPDMKAVHLLIERIDINNKTEISITSTLNTVLGENGRGDAQHILPEILFRYPSFKHTIQ